MELDAFICGELCQNWGALCRHRPRGSKKSFPVFLMWGSSPALVPKLLNLIYEFANLHVPEIILLLICGKRYSIMHLVRLTIFFAFQGSLANRLSLMIYHILEWDFHPQFGSSCIKKCTVSLFVWTEDLHFLAISDILLISAAVEYNCSVYHTVVNSRDNNQMIGHHI